mmetsp:Transcript_14285/g.18017  ORF Transcript_14285/g.18017 Transcript_14285/m.18017 type:complete len:208 (+) Transcript_14285:80-703(+)|eukprot:CAMPEP_0172506936 /NCGR_PEP_ID=MMETSP1066-20121228/199782_1 /TAXON_ID=671091 /ORGANISM="Coscinodiscus wailesii, Strain CCMP2513" /LENGTH=207 /DNA_ID=CAMNT_0013284241 /DNA_START=77 /DNA_END=700 /DNA_ORIENTATION=-
MIQFYVPAAKSLAASILLLGTVAAWQNLNFPSTIVTRGTALSSTNDLPSSRRAFLLEVPLCTVFVTSILSVEHATAATNVISPEVARNQWKQSQTTIENLLQNWSGIAAQGGGDGIRRELGTVGVTSPLFQIDKALKVLRDEAEDLIEFTDQAEEFQLALSRADSMAYSANFAGGSGKPTPPAVYIEKSRKEVIELQRIAKSLTALL